MNFIRCILGFFTKVNTKNEDGYTELHIAANRGQVSLMKQLISRGANVRARNRTRDTPLHGAAKNGHEDAVELLIAKGANVNAKGIIGLTPLHETTDKKIAEMLIANGADIHAKNDEGSTPLTRAFAYHSIGKTAEIIELLIARGADVNSCDSDGDTLLHAAISGYKDDLVKLAIAKGADVNAKGYNGQTALHLVAERSDETAVELAELLISKGANVNPHDDEGITPLYKAVSAYGDCKIKLVKLLLAKGVNINEKDKFGDAPLDLAMRECCGRAVEVLIANGACSVSQQALIWAACVGTVEELKRVIANGADLNAKDDEGETTLIKAAGAGRTASVEVLIAAGADVNARQTNGYTALMAAAENGRSEIVKALIAAGADVNVKYENGKTALMYAYNYPDVVAALRAAGASDGSSAKEESEETFHFAGVTWQREAAPGTMNLEDAHSYASGLTLAGGGWRLPTVDELKALYSAKLSSPAIAAHPGMRKGWYWSGSPYPGGNTYCVNFENGSVAGNVNGKAIMVRCVRHYFERAGLPVGNIKRI
jgi:cytohesin